jgi:hypothetical protein
MPTVNEILDAFGEKLVTDLRNKLRSKGVTFGGGQDSKLAAKTMFQISQTGDGIQFLLTMPPEYYWVNKGRNPGAVNKEGRESIASWAKRKAIVGDFAARNLEARNKMQAESKEKGNRKTYKKLKKLPFKKALQALTFVVAQAVTKNGYEPTYFLDEVLNDGRLKKLQEDINEAGFNDFVTQIKIN